MLLEMAYWVLGIVMAMLILFSPCKPPFLGFHILTGSQCTFSFNHPLTLVLQMIFSAFNVFLNMSLIYAGAYYMSIFLLPCIIYFWTLCEKLKMGIFLKNEYMHLQIFETFVNDVGRKHLIPTILLTLPAAQILFFVALILSKNTVGVGVKGFLIISYISGTGFNLLLFSAAAKIYTFTNKWLYSIKFGGFDRKSYKFWHRVHKSYRPLKVNFSNNFVDTLTPLVIQEFCANSTLSILVLTYLNK